MSLPILICLCSKRRSKGVRTLLCCTFTPLCLTHLWTLEATKVKVMLRVLSSRSLAGNRQFKPMASTAE